MWEMDESYCNGVKEKSPYDEGRILIDIVDMHIFDFITGTVNPPSLATTYIKDPLQLSG